MANLTNDQLSKTAGGLGILGNINSAFTAGLVSAAVSGAILLTGNTYTDRGANTTPQLKLGTGAYLVYTDTVCTNTGGLQKYTACSIQNPLTGTGVIELVTVDSNKAPTASPITCQTSANGTATGTTIFKYQATASGRTIMGRPIGATVSSGALLVPPGWYVRCWHSTTPGPGLKEQLRLRMNEQYVP